MDAATALGEIGEDPDLVVPALVEQLNDEDLWVRTFAAVSLGPFGCHAKAAAPAILRLIEEQKANESWRADLVKALQSVDPETAANKGLK
jgi:HEAT repeat protein